MDYKLRKLQANDGVELGAELRQLEECAGEILEERLLILCVSLEVRPEGGVLDQGVVGGEPEQILLLAGRDGLVLEVAVIEAEPVGSPALAAEHRAVKGTVHGAEARVLGAALGPVAARRRARALLECTADRVRAG